MSQWTHVSGCLRIDGFPALGRGADVAAVLGKPSTRWDKIDDLSVKYYPGDARIPGGSEGTLQYEVTRAGNGMVLYTVAVWGDLRDFDEDDTKRIDEWFTRIVESSLMLRAAHLLVEVECGVRYMLVAHDGKVERIALASAAEVEP